MDKVLKSEISLMVAASLASSEEPCESEINFMKSLWEEFGVSEKELSKEIDEQIEKAIKMNEDEFEELIQKAAKQIPDEEKLTAFELALGVILSDNEFDIEEVSTAAVIANALKLDSVDIIIAVSQLINTKKDLEVVFEI